MVMEDTELADLETQVHQVFKKQLGYYDSSLLTATMSAINQVSCQDDQFSWE